MRGGHIARRSVAQFYDPAKGMFLPDRYIKGICPNCGTPDQYGDNCENCGATYAPTDLKEPRSVLSRRHAGAARVRALLLRGRPLRATSCASGWPATSRCRASRPSCWNGWMPKAACAPGTSRATRPTSASRSPAHPGKYFYVWLDAPIGYLAQLQALCERDGVELRCSTSRTTATPNCTTSSARTSSTSTACSGRRCCTAPASARRRGCTSTAT